MRCLMRSDGTSLIKDSVHNLAATVTGTPTFETLLGVQAPIIAAVPANLLPAEAASFEGGTTGGWNGTNCTLTNSAAWSRVGTKSMKGAPTGSPEVYYDVTSITTAGSQYTLSAWLKSAATSKKFRFTVYDNVTGVQNSALTDITGAEQNKVFTFTFGAGSTLRYIYLERQNLAAGDDFYADAIYLATGYTSVSFPTATLGIAAGMPMSFIAVINSTDTWDNGTYALLMISRSDLSSTYGWELYKSSYGFLAINTWCNGLTKWTGTALSTATWAPNTPHVVIAMMDEANNQRIFLDGVEGFQVSGAGNPREYQVGTSIVLGMHDDLVYPINGSILTAIYEGTFTDTMIADISTMTDWSDLDGLINPPPPPQPVITRQPPGAHIIVQNMAGTSTVSELSEQMPDQQPATNLFEGLSIESCNPGGFTVANFTLHRPVTQAWPDLGHRNRVIIGQGAQVWWEGWIDKPVRKIRPDTFDIGCLGWSARLNQLWATADITAGAPGYLMSTFITAMLADAGLSTNSEVVAGTVALTDYAYPVGTQFQFAPATPYFDALTTLNAGNGYNWGVWLDHKLSFTAATPTVINWFVKTEDCQDLTVTPNPDALCNYALINYTQDGSHYQQVIVQDAASQVLYGIVKQKVDVPGKITTAGATQIANLYLAACKDLHVAAEFTCNRVYDIWGAEHHLAEVRGGDNVRVLDWLPTEDTLSGVNDIATFQIKAAKYDHGAYTLGITPTEFIPQTDILIARLNATGY